MSPIPGFRSWNPPRAEPVAARNACTTEAASPDTAVRQTFVLGLFPRPTAARHAAADIAARTEKEKEVEVLLISGGTLPDTIKTHTPFDDLWASLVEPTDSVDRQTAPHRPCRLTAQIANHVQSGGCLVIARARSTEQRLMLSHVLLEAGCELLMTHDVPAHTGPAA